MHPLPEARFALIACVALIGGACVADKPGDRPTQVEGADPPGARVASSRSAASRPAAPRVVEFGPGIRIDYRTPQVEIDGEIILREGPVELFAYAKSSVPKEHESIVLLRSRPKRIYEALGLIGLVPGHTMRYDWETEKTRLPAGDPVEVLVRWQSADGMRTASVCDWMMNPRTGRPMTPRHWLFTGSERFDDGTFFADIEGTVVTVVDFPSAVLGLPESHSDSDADLWLIANTEAIPAEGTAVTLIVRPVAKMLRIAIDAEGAVTLNGVAVDISALTAAAKRATEGWTERAGVVIESGPGAPADARSRVDAALQATGITLDRIN